MELNNNELMKISGGSAWSTVGIIGGIFFLIGILDGIVRPNACKEWLYVNIK